MTPPTWPQIVTRLTDTLARCDRDTDLVLSAGPRGMRLLVRRETVRVVCPGYDERRLTALGWQRPDGDGGWWYETPRTPENLDRLSVLVTRTAAEVLTGDPGALSCRPVPPTSGPSAPVPGAGVRSMAEDPPGVGDVAVTRNARHRQIPETESITDQPRRPAPPAATRTGQPGPGSGEDPHDVGDMAVTRNAEHRQIPHTASTTDQPRPTAPAPARIGQPGPAAGEDPHHVGDMAVTPNARHRHIPDTESITDQPRRPAPPAATRTGQPGPAASEDPHHVGDMAVTPNARHRHIPDTESITDQPRPTAPPETARRGPGVTAEAPATSAPAAGAAPVAGAATAVTGAATAVTGAATAVTGAATAVAGSAGASGPLLPRQVGQAGEAEPAVVGLLAAAAERRDLPGYLGLLAGAMVCVPLADEPDADREFPWTVVADATGAPMLPVFTSPATLATFAGEGVPFVALPCAELFGEWPDPSWGLAVDPGSSRAVALGAPALAAVIAANTPAA